MNDIVKQIYGRAMTDLAFRQELMSQPRLALQEYNLDESLIRHLVLPNFSWLLDQKIAGSSQPDNGEAFEILKEAGVTAVISLSEKPLDPQKHTLTAYHLPITDFTAPTLAQVEEFVSKVNQLLESGHKVMVHCEAGLGRTGTMLACYLVSQGVSADEAIKQVRATRPGSIETSEQEQIVATYEQHLKH